MEQLTRGQRVKLKQWQLPKQFKCSILVRLPAQTPTIIAAVTNQNQKIESAQDIISQKQSHLAIQITQQSNGQTEFLVDLSQLKPNQQIVFALYFAQPASRLFDEIAVSLGGQIQYRFTNQERSGEQSIILGVLYEKDHEHRFHAYGNGYQLGIEGLIKHFDFDLGNVLTPTAPAKSKTSFPEHLASPLQLPQLWSGRQPTPSIPGGLTYGIYYIEVEQQDGLTSSGSGFAISPGGFILTCYHVIDQAAKVTVTAEQTHWQRNAIVVAASEHHDLALLWLDDRQGLTEWLMLDLEREPALGDELGLLAYPLGTTFGRSVTYSQGIINGVRQQSETSFLQIDTGAAPGSSGGAIFLRNTGKVVGMLHGGLPMAHGMIINLGIDLRNLKKLGWIT
jgi:stress response protein SCP2